MVHVRAEIASGSPSAATVAWALQESTASGSGCVAAVDNTGTAIGGTLNVHTVAVDSYARVEGIMLYNTNATSAAYGGRKRCLRIVLTPAFTAGSSPRSWPTPSSSVAGKRLAASSSVLRFLIPEPHWPSLRPFCRA